MSKVILVSEYFHSIYEEQVAQVKIDIDGQPFISYQYLNGEEFYVEEFPNRSVAYVEDYAENWTFCRGHLGLLGPGSDK
jgi:hypothetical protein